MPRSVRIVSTRSNSCDPRSARSASWSSPWTSALLNAAFLALGRPDPGEELLREISAGGDASAGAGDRQHERPIGEDRCVDRDARSRRRRCGGERCTAQQAVAPIGDGEAGTARRNAVGGLLRKDSLHACAARRVRAIGAQCAGGDSQRGHVADQLDGDRARAFVCRQAQPGASLGIRDARRVKRSHHRDQRERQQGGAQDQEKLRAGRQSSHGVDRRKRSVWGSVGSAGGRGLRGGHPAGD